MLDYYGSITMNNEEIKQAILRHFDKGDADIVNTIIDDFMEQDKINKEYSVSGWLVFFGKQLIEDIRKELHKMKEENKISTNEKT
tara:strand:+ start:84 stop:338 length:255 start_codon:yes stop_codon:yes gene_type:complete